MSEHYRLFDTALGPFGIAWNGRGIVRLQLPEADRMATERRVRARAGTAEPPPPVQQAIAVLHRYLAGERIDFQEIALDLEEVGEFRRSVYEAARAVPWGQTVSYGELARRIGFPWGARAVGQALGRNPVPIIVPCHRILAKGRQIGGFSAHGGTRTKKRLLALEGVRLVEALPLPGILPAAGPEIGRVRSGSRCPDRPPAGAAAPE